MNFQNKIKLLFPTIILSLGTIFVTYTSWAAGPGIGGGGNITCGNVPVSSIQQYISNPKQLPLLKEGWLYVDLLNVKLKDNPRTDLKRYLNYFLNSKKWFLYDCAFDTLSGTQIGTSAPTEQAIRQYSTEIHLSKPLIIKILNGKNGKETLSELLFREQFEALKMLSKDSNFKQCLSIIPTATQTYLCEGISKQIKSDLVLNGDDHAIVRSLTNDLIPMLQTSQDFSVESLINMLIQDNFGDNQWLIGNLSPVYVDETIINNWIEAWRQNTLLLQRRPDLAKAKLELTSCLNHPFLSISRSRSKLGDYIFKISNGSEEFDLILMPFAYWNRENNKNFFPQYQLTPHSLEITNMSPEHQIYYITPISWDAKTNKIGISYPSVNLIFRKENTQFVPIGYSFKNFITTKIDTRGTVHSSSEEDLLCIFK